jgi:hypothetical protein
MALRKNVSLEGNSVIETTDGLVNAGVQTISFSAYIKVVEIYGNKEKITATVTFKGENLAQFNKQYDVPMSVNDGSVNFIAQVYKHLKTLPEFAGAIDC